MIDTDRYRVRPGTEVDLTEWDPRDTGSYPGDKRQGRKDAAVLNARLEELQELLYAQGEHRVLVVLQAMDAGGKDGTIRHVFDGTNPQGVRVASFKQPTRRERGYDYMWRIHQRVPPKGHMAIFNRSHYEDVLVVRVRDLVPPEVWEKRYDHIRNWEKMLADEGATILKFFLHISKKEQKERFEERLEQPDKHWKFSAADLEEREFWDHYMEAFEAVLTRTSSEHAPWYIVPSDRKWFRNLVVSKVLVDTLEELGMTYPAPEEGLDEIVVS